MINPVNERIAARCQAGQHEPGRGAQIGCHNGRGRELIDTLDYCRISLELNIGAHSLHLEYMLESVFEHGLGDCADALSNGIQGAELRLHIRWKRRIRGGSNINGTRPTPLHVEFNPIVARVY